MTWLSQQENKSQRLLTLLILILFGTNLLVKIGGNIWIKSHLREIRRSSDYSYLGYDFPESWPIERENVLMAFDNPKRFQLDTPDGAAEWAAIVPKDGIIHLGPYRQPYSISMFHQLRCLDIIRNETVRDPRDTDKPTELAKHCLNYLRQMVTCRGDLELESFQFASNKNPIDLHGVYECKDWEAVYAEAKRNQREYNGDCDSIRTRGLLI